MYWELHHCSGIWPFKSPGIWPFRSFTEFHSPGPDVNDIQIAPHSSETFSFSGENYFSWRGNFLKGRKIYIHLYIAGRRRFYKKVYG